MRKVNEKYRLKDFWDFGLKQFRSAIFGITIILSLIVTTFIKIPHLARYDTLLICVLALNSKCKVLGFFNVSKGTVNSSLIGIREIYVRALLIGASFIILIHNHPSQDSTPSEKDVEITIRLKEAGELLNIPLADHIIVGEKYYSFKEAGVL